MHAKLVDWIALWVFVVGVWPLADPGHGGDSLLSLIDIALHVAALLVLVARWRVVVVRRSNLNRSRWDERVWREGRGRP